MLQFPFFCNSVRGIKLKSQFNSDKDDLDGRFDIPDGKVRLFLQSQTRI